jgi:hypothetical protein
LKQKNSKALIENCQPILAKSFTDQQQIPPKEPLKIQSTYRQTDF